MGRVCNRLDRLEVKKFKFRVQEVEMKRSVRRLLRTVVVPSVVLVLSSVPVLADVPVVSIQPMTSTVQSGSFFQLAVNISDVHDLFAFQFDLSFNTPSMVLAAQSITEGGLMPTGGTTFFIPGTIDNDAGTITFTVDSLIGPGPGVDGPGVLAFVDFQAINVGTTTVDLSNVMLLDSTLAPIDFTTENATVTAVPEPASLLFLVTVIVGIRGGMAIKRKQSLAG